MATFRRKSMSLRAITLSIAAVTAAACGGGGGDGGTSGGGAKTPDSVSRDGSGPATSGSSDDSEPGGPTEPEPDPCTDGTCFRCGDSICPTGYYCDEGSQACSWLAECADSADCSCVKGALDGCRCEERSGGVYVTCAD